MTALLLVGIVTGVLYGLWTLLGFTFDHIDQWQAALREKREDSSANMERETSDSH